MFRVLQSVTVGDRTYVRGSAVKPSKRLSDDECQAYCDQGVMERVGAPAAVEVERGDVSPVVTSDWDLPAAEVEWED
jgi:hypothetical protein